MANYTVVVGNVGTVYDGPSLYTAHLAFEEYLSQSQSNYGRAAGESVVCLENDEILWEHVGLLDAISALEDCE